MEGCQRRGAGIASALALGLAVTLAVVTPGMAATITTTATARAPIAMGSHEHVAYTLTPGEHFRVIVQRLPRPRARHRYCLGLASALDRGSLPLNLGQVHQTADGRGDILAMVPSRLIPAEPPGPYLLFVGACTSIAPDRPFVAQTMVTIR